nr:hypothetical protein [Streptomyces sp. SID7804]
MFEGRPAADEVRLRLGPYGPAADGRTARAANGSRAHPYAPPPRGSLPEPYAPPPRSRPVGTNRVPRPGDPPAGADGARRADGRAVLLARLTDALCELSCMETPQGRAMFAMLLGDQLGRQVDLRGVRLREDAVAVARAVLAVPAGRRVLVAVVRILEGGPAGDELEWLIDAHD